MDAETIRATLAALGATAQDAARIADELAATAARARASHTQPGIDDDPTLFAAAQP
jgi:hypothetical protein